MSRNASLLVVLSAAAVALLGSTAACSSSVEATDPCLVATPATETNAAAPCLGGADTDARLGLVRSFRRDTTMASNLAHDVVAIPADYLAAGFAKVFLLAFGIDADTMPTPRRRAALRRRDLRLRLRPHGRARERGADRAGAPPPVLAG